MIVDVKRVPKGKWSEDGLGLYEPGTDRLVILLRPRCLTYRQITEVEATAIVDRLLELLPDSIEIPDADDEYRSRPPSYVGIGQSGGASRGSVSGPSTLSPDQIVRAEGGEIQVPARRKDETPEEKRLRRQLRRLRNKEREAKVQ